MFHSTIAVLHSLPPFCRLSSQSAFRCRWLFLNEPKIIFIPSENCILMTEEQGTEPKIKLILAAPAFL
jgi:hypothetical protein